MPQVTLIAEVGNCTTRVALIDEIERVEEQIQGQERKLLRWLDMRVLGQGETPSTLEAPAADVLLGIATATAQIAERSGRILLRDDGQLLLRKASGDGGDGVDRLIVVSSAAGALNLVITAIASDVSARSAVHAARAIPSNVLQVVTLDDTAHAMQGSGISWIERQVQSLIGLQPDLVLMAGGLEGGADEALTRLAHIVSLTNVRSEVDSDGRQRQEVLPRPVVFAGNGAARERVSEALSGHAQLTVVDNLRPTLEHARLDPVQRELNRLYDELILPRLPGAAQFPRLRAPLVSAGKAIGLVTRYLSQHTTGNTARNVLTVDVGSALSLAALNSSGRFSLCMLNGCGSGYGLGALLESAELEAIRRWLPFSISETALVHWILNKQLRPQVQPASRPEMLLEHALVRQLLRRVLAALRDERQDIDYDLLMGAGGVLARAAHPGFALLTLLDALQPGPASNGVTLNIHLDSLGLLASAGALAMYDARSAYSVIEHDLLMNTPLATCVVATGGRSGDVVLTAELRPVGGAPQQVEVRQGEIVRLNLPTGAHGQLTLKPAAGVRIGSSGAGEQVSTDPAEVAGAALGVVIDARGRPLPLADDETRRQQQIWGWLTALGAVEVNNPYLQAPPFGGPEREIEAVIELVAETIPAGSEMPESTLETDLAQLRRTVEEPKRRGLFRRR